MTTSSLIIRSSIARSTFTVVALGVSFFMMPFIIKHLGDRWYGILMMLSALTGYYYFIDFGLASAVTRYVTMYIAKEDNENANIIINTSLAIYIVMAFLILILTLLVSYFVCYFVPDTEDLIIVRTVIIILGINLALEFPFKAFAGVMGACLRYDLLTYSHFISLVLNTALTLYFLSQGYGIISLATISLATSFLSNILFYLIAKYLFAPMQMSLKYFHLPRVLELFSYSIWTFVMQIGEQLRYKIDTFVIGWYLSASAVTHYSIGASFPLAVINLVYRATNFLVPVFTMYYARGDYEGMKDKLLLATKINTILVTFGGGLLIIIGKPLILRWIGSEYLDAYPVLVVLTIGIIIEAIQNPSNNVLMAISKHKFFAYMSVVEGVSKFILSILLIQKYGMLGVAIGTVIPIAVFRMIVMPFYVAGLVKMSLETYYSPIILVVGGTCIYLFAVSLLAGQYLSVPEYSRLIIIALLSVPVYLGIILFTFLSESERKLIHILFPRRISAQ
jgi:O-antigen/teichoic acid export membrane protein